MVSIFDRSMVGNRETVCSRTAVPLLAIFVLSAQAADAAEGADKVILEVAALAAPLKQDISLHRAAGEHALELLEKGSADLSSVRKALVKQGLTDAQVLPFAAIGEEPDQLEAELRAFVRQRIVEKGLTHFGIDMKSIPTGKTALVAIFVRRFVDLGPIPRSTRAVELDLRGLMLIPAPLRAYMTTPRGEVRDLAVETEGRSVLVPLSFEQGAGKYTFELIADGARGPEVAALWSLGFQAPPPEEPRRTAFLVPQTGMPIDARALVRGEIDASRRTMGRAPLRDDVSLHRAADVHAKAVCDALLAAHVLGGKGPEARAAAAGYRGKVAENVAIARSPGEAHANLMDSPSHRRNIIERKAKDLGIGVARREGTDTWCVVQLFGAL